MSQPANTLVSDQKLESGQVKEENFEDEEVTDTNEVEKSLLSFLEELQKILGISDKEITELMQKSGLTALDLLDPVNLQELILNQFGSDRVTDALVNEPLANVLQEGLQALSQLKEEIGQIMGEEVSEVTPQMVSTFLSDSGSKINQNYLKSKEELEQSTKNEESINTTSEKEITIVVEKEASTSKDKMEGESIPNQDRKSDFSKPIETKTDFVDYFTSKVNQTGVDGVNQTTEPVNVRNIITQIVHQIKVNISQSQTSMQMLLNPENLGHVELLVTHKEGVMAAHFTVENQVTKEALESSLNILKQSFEEQGLKISDVEVTVANYSDSFTREQGNGQAAGQEKSKRRTSLRELDMGEESDDILALQAERTNYNGTVEYTA